MQYEVSKLGKNNLSLNKSQVFFGFRTLLFCFRNLFTRFFYLSIFRVIWFCRTIFYQLEWAGTLLVLYYTIHFLICFIYTGRIFGEYFIENRSFKNLLTNIVSVIFVSLFFLVVFQILLRNQNVFINEYLVIARGVSFSGFIAIPLVLFLFHNFGKNLYILNKYSYSLLLFIWIISTQIFL